MKTKHTPGPWELTSIQFRVAANRRDQVSRFIADCNENHGDSEENEANARLIASSPDLLQALMDLHRERGFRDLLHLKHVNAIIAKATGEQP